MSSEAETVAPAWDPARDETLICRAVRDETHDVKTFVFSAPAPRLFRFRAGQFMTFEFSVDGATVSRCYTIASPPTRPDRIAITVKRQPGGVVSPWLHRAMKPGVAVPVSGPMGDFTPAAQAGARLLFLSAGSGITPLMSAMRTVADLGAAADVLHVHSARTKADVIFRRELALLGVQGAARSIVHCTRPAPGWDGLQGRLSSAMLGAAAPDVATREVYACGPAGYLEAVRAMLRDAGHDPSRYHEESFDFAPETVTEAPVSGAGQDAFRIELTKSGVTLPCPAGMTILEAARLAGLRLPSSCTRGVCGTCKSTLVAGRVDMQHGGGIRKREIDQGLILLCCSRPETDLVIER